MDALRVHYSFYFVNVTYDWKLKPHHEVATWVASILLLHQDSLGRLAHNSCDTAGTPDVWPWMPWGTRRIWWTVTVKIGQDCLGDSFVGAQDFKFSKLAQGNLSHGLGTMLVSCCFSHLSICMKRGLVILRRSCDAKTDFSLQNCRNCIPCISRLTNKSTPWKWWCINVHLSWFLRCKCSMCCYVLHNHNFTSHNFHR